VAYQLVFGIQVRLGIRPEANPEALELLQVVNRRADAFAAKAVQAPEDQHVKRPALGRLRHLVEARAFSTAFAPGFVINELASGDVSLALK